MITEEDTKIPPIISMLLESDSDEPVGLISKSNAENQFREVRDTEPDHQVGVQKADLPFETISDFLEFEKTSQFQIADTSNFSFITQDADALCFDRSDFSASSLEKLYAKLYSTTTELLHFIKYLGKWVYSKGYQYYWYGVVNFSIRYPKLGNWL